MIERIIEWNKSRNNLTFDNVSEFQMLHEELQEFLSANTEHDQVDALADLIVVAIGGIHKLGYDVNMVMNECLLHIESRRQQPEQKDVWEKWGASGKWLKDRTQTDVYQPSYKECVL